MILIPHQEAHIYFSKAKTYLGESQGFCIILPCNITPTHCLIEYSEVQAQRKRQAYIPISTLSFIKIPE